MHSAAPVPGSMPTLHLACIRVHCTRSGPQAPTAPRRASDYAFSARRPDLPFRSRWRHARSAAGGQQLACATDELQVVQTQATPEVRTAINNAVGQQTLCPVHVTRA